MTIAKDWIYPSLPIDEIEVGRGLVTWVAASKAADLQRNPSRLRRQGGELHLVAHISQPLDKSIFLSLLAAAVEVVGAKIQIHGSVFEHVIDGREDGSGNGDNRLLGAAPRSDAVELSLKVGALGSCGRPGALHQRSLEPGRSLANATGSALARALVIARADARP